MLWSSIAAISAGAAIGAVLRWYLSIKLNSMFPEIPPGTLCANLVGAYLIGIAISVLAEYPSLPTEVRLAVITGFLGGLTTFSTFSAEVVSLLREGRLMWACAALSVHVIGSLSMTFLGIATVSLWRGQR